jgi:hypothetical protein
MPAAMTYDSLVRDIKAYAQRVDDELFDEQIPRLIMLAENAIAAKFKTLNVVQVGDFTLTSGSSTFAKPAYWRNTLSLSIELANGRRHMLRPRSFEFCVAYSPDATALRVPLYYADYNYKNFFLSPTPDANYEAKLIYLPRVTPLSPEAQVNYVTETAPQLLLAACMVEANLWLKNMDKVQMWSQRMAEALGSLDTENSIRSTDRTERAG